MTCGCPAPGSLPALTGPSSLAAGVELGHEQVTTAKTKWLRREEGVSKSGRAPCRARAPSQSCCLVSVAGSAGLSRMASVCRASACGQPTASGEAHQEVGWCCGELGPCLGTCGCCLAEAAEGFWGSSVVCYSGAKNVRCVSS